MDWIAAFVSVVVAVASALPALPHAHGLIRSLGFPRLQILSLAVVGILLALVFAEGWLLAVSLVLGAGAAIAQIVRIFPFTPFVPVRVASHDGPPPGQPGAEPHVRILATNVKQSNRRYDDVVALVLSCDPDIAIFMETDDGWADALEPALDHYPHRITYPQGNGYGMMLAARTKLLEQEVRFLMNPEVPSFDCVFETDDGDVFRAIALHPEPPDPRQDTIGRDAEIGQVALMVRDEERPVIVFGDLNDVAWSRTTRRFLRISRLADPRRGRGMLNSFDSRYWFLRWPLDHIFVSRHFEVVAMRRMPHVGSDHFPMFYELALTEHADTPSEEVEPMEDDDLEEVTELIRTEKGRTRRPIGYDWEG